MDQLEFNTYALARVLTEAGAAIVVGGDDSRQIVGDMVHDRCCRALWEIREVLNDDSLSDPACFGKIEGILSVLETLGPGGGSRHDL